MTGLTEPLTTMARQTEEQRHRLGWTQLLHVMIHDRIEGVVLAFATDEDDPGALLLPLDEAKGLLRGLDDAIAQVEARVKKGGQP